MLALEDLAGYTEAQVVEHILETFEIETQKEELARFKILIAYESVGSWGCDSSNWFLLEDVDGTLFENHGGHCSCYGFEGQWAPEETSMKYLLSDKFWLSLGGYDGNPKSNKEAVKKEIARLAQG